MIKRTLGKTGYQVGVVGFGAWAIGGDWGDVDDEVSLRALHAAVDAGVNFFDTADVYGDGRSERLIARLRRERSEEIIVATKAGRRAPSQDVSYYTRENLRSWVERSLRNLATERLDLLQLHCPPTDVYYRPEVFGYLDELVSEGKIAHYGVSVERVEEALKAIEYPGVASVQIIYNIFRQRPARRFFPAALECNVGVIVRVPLASGLLTGKISRETTFAPNDHRNFNREGQAFDVGETFAGIGLERGLELVEAVRGILGDQDMTEAAIRFCYSHSAVSCVIPGAKTPEQARANARAGEAGPLPDEILKSLERLYEEKVPWEVKQRW
jgi:aryl-alcohol dehydrogenase-like predicted oxidoreductase